MMRIFSVLILLGVMCSRALLAASCPANSPVAATCGNRVCEGLRGETPENCARDCEDRSRKQLGFVPENLVCPPTRIFKPKSVAEARRAMIETVASNRRVRIVGHAHSSSQMICSDGNIISTQYLKKIYPVETWNGIETVVAEPGVSFWQLMQNLNTQGKALGFAVPGYAGLTLGGFLGAGGHGTDAMGVSTFAHQVVAVDVMDPAGRLVTYHQGNTDPLTWKGLKANLGLLGMVTALRIKVEPQFHVHLKTRIYDESLMLQPGGLRNLVDGCNYVFLRWLTGVGKVMLLCGTRTTEPVDEGAKIALFDPEVPAAFLKLATKLFQHSACHLSEGCTIEKLRYDQEKDSPPVNIIDSSGKHYVWDATGLSHNMTTDFLASSLPTTPYTDWEVAFPERFADEAIAYIGDTLKSRGYCLPYAGVIVRYDQVTDDALMAGNAAGPGFVKGEGLVHIELPQFVPWGFTEEQRMKYEGILVEIGQHLVTQYGARPHWGKNRALLLTSPEVQEENAYNRSLFNHVIARMDPYGVFSNETTRKAGFASPLYGNDFVQAYYPLCANTSLDSDHDGIPDCAEQLIGTPAVHFNGMKVEIKKLSVASTGSCRALRTHDKVERAFSRVSDQAVVTDGWNLFAAAHSYTDPTYPFKPAFSGAGSKSWQMRATGNFVAHETASYCFSVNTGRRSCGQVWMDGKKLAEDGRFASHAKVSCVSLSAGETYPIEVVGRFHHPNLQQPFELETMWCSSPSGQCVPNRILSQEDVLSP